MVERNVSALCPDWNVVQLTGRSSIGPVYEVVVNDNGQTKKASALVISIPQSKTALDRMRASGMNDLSIMMELQKQVSDALARYRMRKNLGSIPGIVQYNDYKPPTRHANEPGWDIVFQTEPILPLAAQMDLVRSEDQIQRFAKQMAEALDSCQRYGLPVGSITPESVFVTTDGSFKLCPFDQPQAGAPPVTCSLGLMLYWLLSGQRGSIPASGSALRPLSGKPSALKQLVMKACAAKGETGFASAREMLDALNAIGAPPAPAPIPVPVPEPVPTPIPAPTPSDNTSNTGVSNESDERRKKRTGSKMPLLIGGIIALIAVILLLLRTCTGTPDTPQTEPTATTQPVSADQWSEWMDQLPDHVTMDEYMVQEQPLYRTSALETTSSVTDTVMDGWTFVETVDELGEFDAWSEWNTAVPETVPNREIETELRYSSQTKQTQTSSSPTMEGWTHYDTTTERTNFGSWSDWSTKELSSSDTLDAASKKQYRYREREYTSSKDSSLSGWNQYDSESTYGSWGSWSEWSDTPVSDSDTREVKTRQVEIPGKTTYVYGAYFSDSGTMTWTFGHPCGTCAAEIYGGTWSYKTVTLSSPLSSSTSRWSCSHKGTVTKRYRATNGVAYCYETVNVTATTYKTQYSYRTRSKDTTYYYHKWGSWSDWSDSAVSSSSDRDVESRTVYRSRSCVTNYTYHFYRWTDWSDWSPAVVTANDSTNVETQTFYRYRDRLIIPTHYFKRWGPWGTYTTEFAAPSDTLQVVTKIQLRYRPRTAEDGLDPQEWTITDIPADSPNYEAVKWVIDRGIMKGTSATTFTSAGAITRRQMAIMFWRAMGYPEPQNIQISLTDVTSADPYRKAIIWALEAGLAEPETADTFGANTPATRSQFIAALYRVCGSPSVSLAQEPFTDVEQDMPFYNAILWAYERGISSGVSITEFGVDLPCERIHAAIMLHTALGSTPEEPPATTAPDPTSDTTS